MNTSLFKNQIFMKEPSHNYLIYIDVIKDLLKFPLNEIIIERYIDVGSAQLTISTYTTTYVGYVFERNYTSELYEYIVDNCEKIIYSDIRTCKIQNLLEI